MIMNEHFDPDRTALALAKALLKKGLESQNADIYDNGLARYSAAVESIEKKGEWYQYLLERYSEAVELGNDYIDIDATLNDLDREGKEFVQNLKKYGIDRFTYSSKLSAIQYEVRVFLNCGCRLIDVVDITQKEYPIGESERISTPAFLFEV